MIKKNFTTVEDFLSEKSFLSWAKDSYSIDSDLWDEWIVANPNKRELICEAKDIALGIQFKDLETNIEKVHTQWKLFENRVNHQKLKSSKKRSSQRYIIASLAASVVLLISTALYTFYGTTTKIMHSAGYGEVLQLKLIDGTSVTLNANSSISYYENNHRKVWLKGEAFFEVQKETTTNAKFIVLTKDLDVQVYGTAFNVNSRNQKTAVFLEEGNIRLALKNGSIEEMSPGNFVAYSFQKDSEIEFTKKMDSKLQTSWKDGSIVFENIPLSSALKKIEETYGLNAVFKDELSKEKLITGSVPVTNLNICLRAIEKSVGVTIHKRKNTLIIRNKK